MSDTVWVAIIVALSSSIPTVIITALTLYFDNKFKRFELSQLAKDKAVVDYFENVANCTIDNDYKNTPKYQKSVQVLLYYFPDLDVDLLNSIITKNKIEGIDKKLERIYPIIKQLSRSRKDL